MPITNYVPVPESWFEPIPEEEISDLQRTIVRQLDDRLKQDAAVVLRATLGFLSSDNGETDDNTAALVRQYLETETDFSFDFNEGAEALARIDPTLQDIRSRRDQKDSPELMWQTRLHRLRVLAEFVLLTQTPHQSKPDQPDGTTAGQDGDWYTAS